MEALSLGCCVLCNSGLVAGSRILFQDAFKNGAVNGTERFVQGFCSFISTFNGDDFLDSGSDRRFERDVALAVSLGNVNPFFCGSNSWHGFTLFFIADSVMCA